MGSKGSKGSNTGRRPSEKSSTTQTTAPNTNTATTNTNTTATTTVSINPSVNGGTESTTTVKSKEMYEKVCYCFIKSIFDCDDIGMMMNL